MMCRKGEGLDIYSTQGIGKKRPTSCPRPPTKLMRPVLPTYFCILALCSAAIAASACSDGRTNSMEKCPGKTLVTRYHGLKFDGQYDGRGHLFYCDTGTKEYWGSFKAGQFSGWGEYYSREGNRTFEGQFQEGAPDGIGRTFYKNGNTHYIGQWKQGQRQGNGILFYSDGSLAYDGQWKADLRHGYGRFYVYGRLVFEGRFEMGKMISDSEISPFLKNNLRSE